MSTECFPITVLPHVSALYRDYLSLAESAPDAGVRRWFGAEPFGGAWFRSAPSKLGARAAGDLRRHLRVRAGSSVPVTRL